MLMNYWLVSKQLRPILQDRKTTCAKTKTQNSGFERPWDQDHGLEDYIFDTYPNLTDPTIPY